MSTIRATSRPASADDRRHWCTAQCSLSTGTSSAPGVDRNGCTTGPAAIRLSLLASASRLPAAQRGDRDRQAGEADDGVDDDVGGLDQVGQVVDDRGRRAARRRPRHAAPGRRRRRARGGTRLACSTSVGDDEPTPRRDDLVAAGSRRGRRRASGCRSSRTTRRWRRGPDSRQRCRPTVIESPASGSTPPAGRTGSRRSGRARRRGPGRSCRSP